MINKTETTRAIPDALRNFDNLPDAANVRDKTVAGIIGCSIPTVWRMSKDGRLPRPRKLSVKVTAWNVGELRRKLAAAV